MSHSAVYPTGLTADGVDLTRTDGRIFMRVTAGLAEVWATRGSDTTIGALEGQIARNRRRHSLAIVAEGMVMGVGAGEAAQRADFRDTVDAIRALMDPTQAPYDLVVTLEDASTRTIPARPVNVMWGDDDIPTYRELSCEWIAVGDDWA